MNERIKELWAHAVLNNTKTPMNFQDAADEFAKLVWQEAYDEGYNAGAGDAILKERG